MWSMNEENSKVSSTRTDGNFTDFSIENIWYTVINEYIIPLAQYCITMSYIVYTKLTPLNMTIIILKYIPIVFYLYKFIKDIYLTSRKRIKQKQVEIEEIQMQIQLADSKLVVRDAEFAERSKQLQRGAERLKNVRARVRDFIGTDDALRRSLEEAVKWDSDNIHLSGALKEEDNEFIADLLKELKYDNLLKPELEKKIDRIEHGQTDSNTPENSVYSSLSDVDIGPDCRIKIVKVTNVYKIAYLKHYIKQKKVRRATKQALLKKKIENIKTLLEDWQRTLNMVINSKLTILNIESQPIDLASQAAMGDYSKPRGSSDSDSDMKNSWSDNMCYDEYNLNWTQNPYKPYYEDNNDTSPTKDTLDCQDFNDGNNYPSQTWCCDCGKSHIMTSIVEETKSQIAIEEKKSESDCNCEWRDHMTL